MQCAAASSTEQKTAIKLWLVDSGCACDVVCRKDLRALSRPSKKARVPMRFEIANGLVNADETVDIELQWLGETSLTMPLIVSGTAIKRPPLGLPLFMFSLIAGLINNWKLGRVWSILYVLAFRMKFSWLQTMGSLSPTIF